ncbi:MAG: nucleotidyltransferase family protein [Desulfosarcinaceae bacterium]
MGKQDIINMIKASKPELTEHYGVRQVGLFGSYVRGQENPSSDIDILVSFNRDIDLFEFIDLKEYFENKLQAKVDLVMASALKPSIGKRILAEVQYV